MSRVYSAVQTKKGFKAVISIRGKNRKERVVWVSPFSLKTAGEAIDVANKNRFRAVGK